MTSIALRAFAKINLGLSVLARQDDGYHEIRTVLQAIDLHDDLVLEDADRLSLEVEGPYNVPADASNLAIRAARALVERYPGRGARIRLRKRIPPGSGLGGGSADAAAVLLGLDRLWDLGLDPGLLYSMARRLGADVPFFLYGGTCLGVGRGDEIFPMPDGPSWRVIVAWPGVTLSTKEVYEGLALPLTRGRIPSSMKGFMPPGVAGEEPADGASRLPGAPRPESEQGALRIENDLEKTAFDKVPGLEKLKDRLLDSGAAAASLSGSGSAVFGLFASARRLDSVAASIAKGGVIVFRCHTLTREAYREKLFPG